MAEKLLKKRYLIEDIDQDKLGAGSFGSTYLAKDTRYRSFIKKVVVKHLQPPARLFDIALKFFQREAEVLSKLGSEHSQIPTLIDSFAEGNEFYIVQEWIDGETLSNVLTYGKQLTQKDTIDLLIEILEPLKFCHDEGTIHRDLKPANLMRRRSDGKLVIIDFGAVREVGQLTLMPDGQERPGSIIGTPGYASPEQCAMFPSPVLASDIYAVGSIGIQAMTGLPPSKINTPFEEIPRWWEVPDRTNATPGFTEILNKMLAFSPKARYYDASAALEVLRAITAKYTIIKQSVIVVPISTQSPAVTQPNILQIPNKPVLKGELSQEIFTFETAKLRKLLVPNPRRLGTSKAGNRQTKIVEEWEVKKFMGKAERFTEDLGNDVKLEMVYIPDGSFKMGSDDYDSEKPQHVVHIPSFYMGRFQVTQEQYLTITGTNPAKWKDAKLPVEQIYRNEAQIFCQRLSNITGKKYRLPSESEWEYACCAETTTPFSFGKTISTTLANYNGDYTYKSGAKGHYRGKTTPVGSFPANGFGLHDMHGNVFEWCEDQWHENYQEAPTDGTAWVDNDDFGLLRGGSCHDNPRTCRSTSRSRSPAVIQDLIIGFRLACN
jgi:eukaryotic-like serine/threonine-protein kinase